MPTIQKGKVVEFGYHLTDSKGETLDKASSQDPFAYMHGQGQIVPGLEKALEGMRAGDKKKVEVGPAEGYGEMDPSLKIVVNRKQFPADMEIESGMQFQATAKDGQDVVFTVTEVKGEDVHVDGNHPLAGQTLHFDVEILKVRDATAEEISHGHVHGPGGHHHHD